MRSRGSYCFALAVGAFGLADPAIARADDRAAAKEILTTVDRASKDDAITQAEMALERGTRMRNAGDDIHARVAEGLALEWALLARERARTRETEKEARASEVAVLESGARVERERALLEEAIARSGRLRAELASKQDAKDPVPRSHVSAPTRPTRAHEDPREAPKPPGQDADAPGGQKGGSEKKP